MENDIKKSALLVATLGSFLIPFMGSSVNVALPVIGREFSLDAIMLSWVATAFFLSTAMFLLPVGRLADIHGRKRIFLYGITIYTFSSLLSGLSTGAYSLIFFRILQGIGGAMIFGMGIAILTSVFPPNERGKVLGINVAAVYLGLTIGPFVGGFLTQHLGWRSIFFFNVPLGLVIIGAIVLKLKGEWAEARGEKFDLAGSIIYSLALVTIMYGFSLLPLKSGVFITLAGFFGLLIFIKWELSIDSPIIDIKILMNNRVFAFSNLAAFANYSATFAVGFLLSLFLQYIKGLSPQETGMVLLSQPLVMALFSPFAGKLSDRIEPRIVASSGMGLIVIGLVLLTRLSPEIPIASIITYLVIVGFGFALFSSPNANAIMGSVEKRFLGVASASLGTMRVTGQMFSMGIAMVVFALVMGRVEITPQYYPQFLDSIKIAFSIFAFLCFFGIFSSLIRGKMHAELSTHHK